jgi:hypothetical protein
VAVAIRHFIDATAIIVWAVAVAAGGLGFWMASRLRKEEDLVSAIFPDEP